MTASLTLDIGWMLKIIDRNGPLRGQPELKKLSVFFEYSFFAPKRVFAYEIAYVKKNITNFIMNFVFQFRQFQK